ncbi:hypothetical protein HAX54_035887, partial [Datura stramonium]|nr:hypothetical protein [Datura stramonium]
GQMMFLSLFILLNSPLSQGLFPLNFSVLALVLREHSRSLFPRAFLHLVLEHLSVQLKMGQGLFHVHPCFL